MFLGFLWGKLRPRTFGVRFPRLQAYAKFDVFKSHFCCSKKLQDHLYLFRKVTSNKILGALCKFGEESESEHIWMVYNVYQWEGYWEVTVLETFIEHDFRLINFYGWASKGSLSILQHFNLWTTLKGEVEEFNKYFSDNLSDLLTFHDDRVAKVFLAAKIHIVCYRY